MSSSVSLRQSHSMPKGVYRILRDRESANPNPVLLTERFAVPTSKQLTAYLLCGKCGKRLSNCGENWVLQPCPRRGSFKLVAILDTESPPEVSSDTRIYRPRIKGEFDGICIMSVQWFSNCNDDRSSINHR